MDTAELNGLDRAVVELARADRDDGTERIGAAITAVALAWIKLDEREQACSYTTSTRTTTMARRCARRCGSPHRNKTLAPYRRTLTRRRGGHGHRRRS